MFTGSSGGAGMVQSTGSVPKFHLILKVRRILETRKEGRHDYPDQVHPKVATDLEINMGNRDTGADQNC